MAKIKRLLYFTNKVKDKNKYLIDNIFCVFKQRDRNYEHFAA